MKIADIKKITAAHFGVTAAELESVSRRKRVTWPRQVAMALCRIYLKEGGQRGFGCSTVMIGRHFGKRDHTTVIHASSAILSKVADPVRLRDVQEVCAAIEVAMRPAPQPIPEPAAPPSPPPAAPPLQLTYTAAAAPRPRRAWSPGPPRRCLVPFGHMRKAFA